MIDWNPRLQHVVIHHLQRRAVSRNVELMRAVIVFYIGVYLKLKNLKKKSGRPYGLVIHGNRIITLLVFNRLKLKSQAENIKYKIDEKAIKQEASDSMNDVLSYLEQKYSENMLATLFKNNSKCRDIVANCS